MRSFSRILSGCCLLAAFCLFGARAHAQSATSAGTDFWLGYMENLDLGGNGAPYLYVVVNAQQDAQVLLEVPATGDVFPYSVPAGGSTVIYLPSNFSYPIGAEVYYDDGLRITSDVPVTVHAIHHRLYFSEATLVLPYPELGTDYRVVAEKDVNDASPSEFLVQATADGTEVQITPSVPTSSFRPAGVPFTVVLDAGNTFQLQSFDDLTGSVVTGLDAAKPIAVFGGSKMGRVTCTTATDHLWTQLMPTTSWGTHFAVVPYKDRGGDIFKVIALNDGTTVSATTGLTLSLNAGEYATPLISDPALISSNAPIAVVQFNQSQDCNGGAPGDGCMAFVPPSDHRSLSSRFWSLTGPGGATTGWTPLHTLNVVLQAKAGAPAVLLDGVDIGPQFQPMPAAAGWFFVRKDIVEGPHVLESASPYQAQVSAFGDYNGLTFYTGYQEELVSTAITSPEEPDVLDLLAPVGAPWVFQAAQPFAQGTLTIVDATGRVVRQWSNVRDGQVVRHDLGPGAFIYLFHDRQGGVRQRGRLVVMP